MDSSAKYQKFVVSHGDEDEAIAKSKSASKRQLIIGVLLIIALIAAISAVAVGVGVGVGVFTSKQSAPAKGLSTITVTQEKLEGVYYGLNGDGILFSSTVNSTYFVLSITTTNGQPVVFIIHPVVSNMTIMSVNDTNFMIMENQPDRVKYDDYIIPKDAMNMMESIMSGEREMSDEVYKHIDNKTVNETRESMLSGLATSYEAQLIIEAAQAIGDQGFQGTDYPAVMRFYLFALQLSNSRDLTDTTQNRNTRDTNFFRQKRAVKCNNGATCASNKCPSGNNCFGMCGKGCSCWSFVCGNCCVNQYCLTHDQCCADKGFFSWACLSVAWRVLGSRCYQNYSC